MIDPNWRPGVNDVERVIARLERNGHDATKAAAYLRAWVGEREPGSDDEGEAAEEADAETATIGELTGVAKDGGRRKRFAEVLADRR